MWYFAYDDLSSHREMIRVAQNVSPKFAAPLPRYPAILRNYRICFPIFSEQSGGGAASVVPAPGKYVAGALFDLPRNILEQLDGFYARSTNWSGREQGVYRRIQVEVRRFDSETPFIATAHQAIADDGEHYPPSRRYIAKLIAAACDVGLSSLWIEQLFSFSHHHSGSFGSNETRMAAMESPEDACIFEPCFAE